MHALDRNKLHAKDYSSEKCVCRQVLIDIYLFYHLFTCMIFIQNISFFEYTNFFYTFSADVYLESFWFGVDKIDILYILFDF